MKQKCTYRFVWLILLFCAAMACDDATTHRGPRYANSPNNPDPVYDMYIQGLMNVGSIIKVFQPLATYLEAHLPGKKVRIKPVYDFKQFQQITGTKNPPILIANPLEAYYANRRGYRVAALLGEPRFSTATLLVKDTSRIYTLNDLFGKRIAFPPSSAFIGTMVPEYSLYNYNLNLYRSIEKTYLSALESPFYYLLDNKSDAIFVTYFNWHRFQRFEAEKAAKLRSIYTTSFLYPPALLLHPSLSTEEATQLEKAILAFNQTPLGIQLSEALGSVVFLPPGSQPYKNMETFLQHFEKHIRPIYQ